jgi:hypothetical protein
MGYMRTHMGDIRTHMGYIRAVWIRDISGTYLEHIGTYWGHIRDILGTYLGHIRI